MDYTLPNENGNPYDFGDPEFWEAYGADPDGAKLFAQGFPEYWKSAAGWYANKAHIDEAAERMRRQAFDRLPSMKKNPFLFSSKGQKGKTLRFDTNHLNKVLPNEKAAELDEAAVQSKRIPGVNYIVKDLDLSGLIGHKPETKDTSWNEPIENGPFKYLEEGTRNLKEYSEESVPLKYWYAIGRTYVEALRKNDSRPSPLPGGVKRRERLEDGAIFRKRTRCGHQVIVATNANSGSGKCIRWGPALYDYEKAVKRHFLVVGGPRSGKTSLLRLFIQSLYRERSSRTIIYDFKTELIPSLSPFNGVFFEDYYLLNPYDARGAAWDIAKDVDENTADTLAAILIPGSADADKEFFTPITRNILAEVVRALISRAGCEWTLLDLMLAIQPENVRSVLAETSQGRRVYNANIKGDSITQQNILSLLDKCSRRYVRIASAWEHAEERLSLRKWVANETKGIVLGHNNQNSASIKPVIRGVIHFLMTEMLNHTEKPCHTFMVLDEFSRLGRLEDLQDVMEAAPSQGLSVVLGVHDIDTVKETYKQGTHGLLGACYFRAFLRTTNPETTHWVSKHIGHQDVTYELTSQSESESNSNKQEEEEGEHRFTTGSTTSLSIQHVTRPAVPAELISQLPLASKSKGINGYFFGPGHPVYKGSLSKSVFDNSGDGSCCRNDEDGASVDDYVLWVPTGEEEPTKPFVENPKENFKPPEDSFETLEKLGFTFDPTSHSQTLPLPERQTRGESTSDIGDPNCDGPAIPSVKSTESNTESVKSSGDVSTTDAASEKRYDIRDCVWDDELECWRSKTEDD